MDPDIREMLEVLQSETASFPRRVELGLLTYLDREDERALREAWPRIPVEKRRRLITALVEMAEDDATLTFEDVFLVAVGDSDAQVRVAALQGLWDYMEEDFIPTLVDMMKSDPSVAVRAEAAASLSRFANAGELGDLNPDATEYVRRALVAVWNSPDEDVEVRRRALESLSFLSVDEVPEMIRAAYSDTDERMNASAVYAMGQTLDEAWAPYVLRELKNPRPEMRYEAAHAAGELRLTDALPMLLDLAHDADAEVRIAAITSLGLIGGERALQALLELARSADEVTREAALDALEIAMFEVDPLSPLAAELEEVLSAASGIGVDELFEGWDEDEDEADDEDADDEDEDEDDWGRDRWN